MFKKNKVRSIALVPDRFASYRYTVFKRLSDFQNNGFYLTIYADIEEDVPGLKLVDSRHCDRDYLNGGISWVRIRNIAVRGICFWQTGLLRLAFLKEHDVHVYWGEAHRFSTWLSAMLSLARGKKVVFWTHGIYGNEGLIKGWMRQNFYRLAHQLLVYNNFGKDQLVKSGFSPKKLHIIKNSLDCQMQNKLFNKYGSLVCERKLALFSESDRVLIFIGRLEPQKRLKMLLDALKILNKGINHNYKLLIIGDGSHYKELRTYTDTECLSQDIVFYGACYEDEELAPLIMMSDVCVSPGEVGLTAMHSLIYGTPVITHNNFAEQMPEFEAIRPNVSGAFYEYNDVSDLCLKIKEVIELVDIDVITSDTCRQSVLQSYNEDYQMQIFNEMLNCL